MAVSGFSILLWLILRAMPHLMVSARISSSLPVLGKCPAGPRPKKDYVQPELLPIQSVVSVCSLHRPMQQARKPKASEEKCATRPLAGSAPSSWAYSIPTPGPLNNDSDESLLCLFKTFFATEVAMTKRLLPGRRLQKVVSAIGNALCANKMLILATLFCCYLLFRREAAPRKEFSLVLTRLLHSLKKHEGLDESDEDCEVRKAPTATQWESAPRALEWKDERPPVYLATEKAATRVSSPADVLSFSSRIQFNGLKDLRLDVHGELVSLLAPLLRTSRAVHGGALRSLTINLTSPQYNPVTAEFMGELEELVYQLEHLKLNGLFLFTPRRAVRHGAAEVRTLNFSVANFIDSLFASPLLSLSLVRVLPLDSYRYLMTKIADPTINGLTRFHGEARCEQDSVLTEDERDIYAERCGHIMRVTKAQLKAQSAVMSERTFSVEAFLALSGALSTAESTKSVNWGFALYHVLEYGNRRVKDFVSPFD